MLVNHANGCFQIVLLENIDPNRDLVRVLNQLQIANQLLFARVSVIAILITRNSVYLNKFKMVCSVMKFTDFVSNEFIS